jgi:iron complex outermembrane receptor protein
LIILSHYASQFIEIRSEFRPRSKAATNEDSPLFSQLLINFIMKQVVFTTALLLLCSAVFGQFSILGTVKSTEGESLISANIVIEENSKGTTTDANGNFSINDLKAGTYTISVSYIGFQAVQKKVTIKDKNVQIAFELVGNPELIEVITVSVPNSLRANKNTPMTYYNMDKAELEANNLGQDVPFLLQMTPSTVVTSDAGAGVGYTGIRIRGTDATRINITVNGIPINDAESQGVFWVNMPDFATSTSSIQIQRGVGTSTNGAGAFGGTVNLETNNSKQEKFIGVNGTYGSFNTIRSNVTFNSGMLGKFNINGRASLIKSDGYIDRAASDLWSYQLSGSYVGKNNSLEFITFHGKEITYQAWYGVDSATLATDRTINYAGMEADPPYENQVDNYQQTHYQLLYKHSLNRKLYFDGALHYTRGKGYYEEYRAGEDVAFYNLGNSVADTIATTDLVRRRWLDNHFYGATYALTYSPNDKMELVVGGAANNYVGDHFGETIWAAEALPNTNDVLENAPIRFYEGVGEKFDFNIYSKLNYQLTKQLNAFADLQYRYVSYQITGIDNDKRDITQTLSFNFFNPKVGLTFANSDKSDFYASYAMGNREPSRSDITDAPTNAIPRKETLHDFELGHRFNNNTFSFNTNIYYMLYDDQLVLTGQINDVGAAIRTNVDNSYRLGLELVGGAKVTDWFTFRANATFSQNRIIDFVEYLDDWDNGGQITINHGTTDIAFSPNVIAGAELLFYPLENNVLEMALMSKYVGKQYFDNTSSEKSTLSAFWTNDIRIAYSPKAKFAKNIRFTFLLRNALNELYESNAWIYRYNYEGQVQQFEGFYPQAGRHFFVGVDFKF